MKKPAKSGLLTASLVLVGASALGCSDGGAPSDATEDEFCTSLTSLASKLGSLAEASQKEALGSIKTWARDLEKVGTPEDIPDEARDGFELMIEEVAALDENDTTEDFQKLDEALTASEKKATAAFEKYATDTCGGMQLETPGLPETPTPAG